MSNFLQAIGVLTITLMVFGALFSLAHLLRTNDFLPVLTAGSLGVGFLAGVFVGQRLTS